MKFHWIPSCIRKSEENDCIVIAVFWINITDSVNHSTASQIQHHATNNLPNTHIDHLSPSHPNDLATLTALIADSIATADALTGSIVLSVHLDKIVLAEILLHPSN